MAEDRVPGAQGISHFLTFSKIDERLERQANDNYGRSPAAECLADVQERLRLDAIGVAEWESGGRERLLERRAYVWLLMELA